MTLRNLSIVIPLGPDEDQLPQLLDDLKDLSKEIEIILVSCIENIEQALPQNNIKYISSVQGRACQMNAGARVSQREFIWFLHADSRVMAQTLNALENSIKTAPDAVHFFRLKFKGDGPRLMVLNEWGGWFRSEVLGVPFGDQGFCLRKNIFDKIGGFPEEAPYGEDHLLVWHARQAGVKLRCTGGALLTSARKYRQGGWIALTIKYQYLWLKQALPELWKLIRF